MTSKTVQLELAHDTTSTDLRQSTECREGSQPRSTSNTRRCCQLLYGAGLRVSEVVGLRVSDIDSERMLLRVVEGKGGKDRFVMLSPLLLQRLRAWWRVGRRQDKMLDGGWLFPGMNPVEALYSRQLYRAVRAAAEAAGINKHVCMHFETQFRHPPA